MLAEGENKTLRTLRIAIIGEFPQIEGDYSGGPKEVCRNLFNELNKNRSLKIKRFMPIGLRQVLKNLGCNYKENEGKRFLFYSLFVLIRLIIGKFDIIHFLGYPRKLSFLILLRKLVGAKIIYTANGLIILENIPGRFYRPNTCSYNPVTSGIQNRDMALVCLYPPKITINFCSGDYHAK